MLLVAGWAPLKLCPMGSIQVFASIAFIQSQASIGRNLDFAFLVLHDIDYIAMTGFSSQLFELALNHDVYKPPFEMLSVEASDCIAAIFSSSHY